MQLTMEILVSIFLMIGTFFMLVGGIGMVRLPDLFMRSACPNQIQYLRLRELLDRGNDLFCIPRTLWFC